MIRLSALLTSASLKSGHFARDPAIASLAHDSRTVSPSALFIAISGHEVDGHAFISDAIDRGASAVVGQWSRSTLSIEPSVPYIQVSDARRALGDLAASFFAHPTRQMTTVAVTGTKGKTSVTQFSAAALGEVHTKLVNTITNAIDRGREETTPSALDVQRLARQALDGGKRNLVLEASAHGLAQDRLRGTDVDVAVFTNLSHDHLDYFQSIERYLDAKLTLFRDLKPNATAVVNRDDAHFDRVVRSTTARVLTFGLTPDADVWAEIGDERVDGTTILAHTPVGSSSLEVHFPGRIYARNALAAVAVGLSQGVPLDVLKDRLQGVTRIEGRMERHISPDGFAVVVDFAHSPDSLEQALKTLRPKSGQLITVFGCGGDADQEKRPIMGAISARMSDVTIVTGDNPKGEDPDAILDQIVSGIPPGTRYERVPERGDAIERAIGLARSGDVVLIAGKGHERALAYKDRLIPFNDREHLINLGVIEPNGAHHVGAAA